MADQDFNIKVVTTADTTGLRQTSAEMDAVKRKAEQANAAAKTQLAAAEAKWAASPINPKNAATAAPTAGAAGDTVGLTGSAVGIGTIVTLLTSAISKWKQFNDEQDRWIDGMIKATEKARELGLSIVDMQDKARSAARVGTEPLEQSFARLAYDAAVLKTEIGIAFQSGQFDEVKKLTADLRVVEAQLDSVTAKLQAQAKAKHDAAQSELEKRVPGLAPKDQVQEADAQTQAILKNEQAAAKARAEGRDNEADQFQKSADEYKASATPQQLADLQRIHELQDKLKPATSGGQSRFLTQEEIEAINASGGPATTSEQRAQNQLNNRADRYAGVQKTRGESDQSMTERLNEIKALQQQMLDHQKLVWGN